jgi:ketosteroid isomerase-like protein
MTFSTAALDEALTAATARATANGEAFALVLLDVGAGAGDGLQEAVASRLGQVLRAQDVLVGLEDGRVAVVAADVGQPRALDRLAGRLRAALREPVAVAGRPVLATAAVGRACCPPTPPEELLETAVCDLGPAGRPAAPRAPAAGRGTDALRTLTSAFYDALSAQDVGALTELLAEDVLFVLPAVGPPRSPLSGREQVLAWLAEGAGSAAGTLVREVEVLGDEGRVVVRGEHRHRHERRLLRLGFRHDLTFTDGRVQVLVEALDAPAGPLADEVDARHRAART